MTTTTEAPLTGLAKLRAEVPAHLIGKLPRVNCGDCRKNNCNRHQKVRCKVCKSYISSEHIHLDYVGHAETTSILLDADPGWFWEPMALGEDGLPKFDPINGLWIRLTVCGVTRIGYGTAENSGFKAKGDLVKEVIGDAIRNAAMRFGVALDLWAKTDLHAEAPEVDEPQGQVAAAVERKAKRERRTQPPAEDEFAAPAQDKPSANLLRNMNIALKERGFTADDERYAEVSRLVGRPITSTSQLSAGEARHVLGAMAGTKENPAPNPRNGDRPVPDATAAALWAPTLEKVVTRSRAEGGQPVTTQLLALIADASSAEHVNRVGQLAVEARDGGHLTIEQFESLAKVAQARNAELSGKQAPGAPSAEQVKTASSFADRVGRATTQGDFTDVYGSLVEARDAGHVTGHQYDALLAMLDERCNVFFPQQQPEAAKGDQGWSHSHPAARALAETSAGGGR